MKQLKQRLGSLGLGLVGLVISGCLLISGTFVVVASFSFSTFQQAYNYQVDVTSNSDWKDHKNQIDFIDAVGLEFYITNNSGGPATFNVWVDTLGAGSTHQAGATKIVDNFTVANGTTHITYLQSLGFLTGLDRLKALAKKGQFESYGEASVGSEFKIDSGKVVITFSASK